MRFTDVKHLFDQIPGRFDGQTAQGVKAVFQFDITGPGGGNWCVTVQDSTCSISEGRHPDPTVTLSMSKETWLGIANKEINPFEAFMSGALRVSGDMLMAQMVPELFKL
ncbi:MAG: SCP2 sterol-binding domain-containing protein [Deltaproteobacteria bacterium]|nr:SCP2 sterol-binding domain-containing protein [Deltaproteobacteria bacterium]